MIYYLPFWFGLISGMAAAAHIADLVAKRLQRTKAMHAARKRQLQSVTSLMRNKAKATLALRREEQAMSAELADLTRNISVGEEAVIQQKSRESLLYVLEEHRNPGDRAFVVAIAHRKYIQAAPAAPRRVLDSWASGRSFLIWAASPQAAQTKASMRYPHAHGFAVGSAESYQGKVDEL